MSKERGQIQVKPVLLTKGEIDFNRLSSPKTREKIKEVLRILVNEIAVEHPGKSRLRSWVAVEGEIERIRVFTNPDDFLDFLEATTGKKVGPVKRLTERVNCLIWAGTHLRIGEKDRKTPVLLVFAKDEKTLLHELNHAAERCVGLAVDRKNTDGAVRRRNREILIAYASIVGSFSFLTVASHTPNSGIAFSALLVGSTASLLSSYLAQLAYESVPSEIRARATSRRIRE